MMILPDEAANLFNRRLDQSTFSDQRLTSLRLRRSTLHDFPLDSKRKKATEEKKATQPQTQIVG